MIIELVVSKKLVDIFTAVRVFPLDRPESVIFASTLNPSFLFRCPLDEFVLGPETEDDGVLFFAERSQGTIKMIYFTRREVGYLLTLLFNFLI